MGSTLLKAVFVAATVAVILAGGGFYVGLRGAAQSEAKEEELERLRSRNRQLGRDIADLRERIAVIRDDDRALGRIAREELNMIRDGELVFDFSSKP